jgi:hypothetical protein
LLLEPDPERDLLLLELDPERDLLLRELDPERDLLLELDPLFFLFFVSATVCSPSGWAS